MASRIMDKADRITSIAKDVNSSTRIDRVYFRGHMEELPVIRMPIDMPVYRMNNGRTKVEQYHYLESNDQPKDFFGNGEENVSVQQAQYKILLKLAKDEKGSIYRELEREQQHETLLVTFDGVVLDGNRRLAAMRNLYEHNAGNYRHFSHVDACILPKEANEQDLEILEVQRQMVPDTKLAYGWIERRMKIRQHVEVLKIPRSRIMEMYRFKREDEINVELHQLALVVEYLEDYLNTPHAYHEVAQSEQIFKEIEKSVRGKSGEDAKLRKLVGFMLVKESSNVHSRVYDYRSIFGVDFDKVMTRYARYAGIDLTATRVSEGNDDLSSSEDLLDDLSEREQRSYMALMPIFEDQTKRKEIVEALSRALQSVKDETKEEDHKQAALKKAEKANQTLHEIDLSTADPATFTRIKSQLDAIIAISKDRMIKIEEMVAKNVKGS